MLSLSLFRFPKQENYNRLVPTNLSSRYLFSSQTKIVWMNAFQVCLRGMFHLNKWLSRIRWLAMTFETWIEYLCKQCKSPYHTAKTLERTAQKGSKHSFVHSKLQCYWIKYYVVEIIIIEHQRKFAAKFYTSQVWGLGEIINASSIPFGR
jgi:hypothetical protein